MSFLLVIVATVFLVSGLFLTKDLALIFISIGCSALAGLVLVVAVLRSRPKTPEAAPIDGLGAGIGAVPAPTSDPVQAEEAAVQAPAGPAPAPAASGFPIPNYEELEVVEVLPLLGDLTPAELEAVRQREAARRAHPWILARIDALLESEAETGEWAESRDDEDDEDGFGGPEEPGTDLDWDDEGSEWAPGRSSSASSSAVPDWSASDFELESAEETLFNETDYEAPAGRMPIAGYDDLRANEVLPLLSNLSVDDLRAVRAVEAGGKARTSILSRIDNLLSRAGAAPGPSKAPAKKAPARGAVAAPRGPSKAALSLPIADYDSLTVGQITAQLPSLSAAELRAVRTYERRHKARQGVLAKIEGALARAN